MVNHHHRNHQHSNSSQVLAWALALTLTFALVEALGGWWSGSLALLGDAGHMVSDATALGLAYFAAWIARRPPTARHSYGLGRAEVVAAMVNGLIMLLLVAGIVVTAIERLQTPQPVMGSAVIGVALIGLLINIVVAWILSRGEQTLNVRGALLHVIGDLLGSVAALSSGVVIFFTGWTTIDPILSLFICVLILFSSIRLLREGLHVIMEGVPPYIDLPEVGRTMAHADGVLSIHDLHIWTLSSGMVALSAHVVVSEMTTWEDILAQLRVLLRHQFGIDHVTLQPELAQPSAGSIPLDGQQQAVPRR